MPPGARVRDRGTLLRAVQHEGVDKIEQLLAGGDSVHACDNTGNSALHRLMCECGPGCECVAKLQLLVLHGARLDARNKNENTLLHLPDDVEWEDSCAEAKVEFLLRLGLDPNAVNKKGETPLMSVATADHTGVANVLLQYGAHTDVSDHNGNTVLHWLCDQNMVQFDAKEFAEKLLWNGARSTRNAEGHTPLDILRLENDARSENECYRELLAVLRDPDRFRQGSRAVELLDALSGRQREWFKEYECCVCKALCFEVMQCSQAGHVICVECVSRVGECPLRCGSTTFNRDNKHERVLRQAQGHCVLGCGWQGELGALSEHVLACTQNKVDVKCVSCEAVTTSSDMQEHRNDTCPYRRIKCTWCDLRVPFKDTAFHCDLLHRECPFPDCTFRSTSVGIKQHMADEGENHAHTLSAKLAMQDKRLASLERNVRRLEQSTEESRKRRRLSL